MGAQKSFLLRIDEKVYEAMRIWAEDELRSLNAQIEYVLRQALREGNRLKDERGRASRPDGQRKG
jgi:hypothetical protein